MRLTIRACMVLVAVAAILCAAIVLFPRVLETYPGLPLVLCLAAILFGPWLLVALGLFVFPIVPEATWKGKDKSEAGHPDL